MSRIIGSEDVSPVAIWGKSFPGGENRLCKGPGVQERTGREALNTVRETDRGQTRVDKVSEVVGTRLDRVLGLYCELEATLCF